MGTVPDLFRIPRLLSSPRGVMATHKGCCPLRLLKAALQRGQNPGLRDDGGRGRRGAYDKIAVLLDPTCFSEVYDGHICIIKNKDILRMNYAGKMFSDRVETVCVCVCDLELTSPRSA